MAHPVCPRTPVRLVNRVPYVKEQEMWKACVAKENQTYIPDERVAPELPWLQASLLRSELYHDFVRTEQTQDFKKSLGHPPTQQPPASQGRKQLAARVKELEEDLRKEKAATYALESALRSQTFSTAGVGAALKWISH